MFVVVTIANVIPNVPNAMDFDAPPNSLVDSTTSPNVKIVEG